MVELYNIWINCNFATEDILQGGASYICRQIHVTHVEKMHIKCAIPIHDKSFDEL